jgi:hypothetical protein
MSHHWLESASWAAQIGLLLLASFAAYVGYRQLTAYKLLELMKFIEDEEFRTQRRIVIREIWPLKDTRWWDWDNDRQKKFEAAASGVCARYDILAVLIEFDSFYKWHPRHGVFFTHNWRLSIIDTHSALLPYLEYRRSRPNRATAYDAFSRLRDRASDDLDRDLWWKTREGIA